MTLRPTRWFGTRRLSIPALFAVVVLASIAVEWQLLRTSEKLLGSHSPPTGIDRSFFLDEEHVEHLKGKKWAIKEASVVKEGSEENTAKESREEKKKAPQPNGAYQEDPLCGGCRSLQMDHLQRGLHKERCGILIYNTAKENNFSIRHAARHVVHKLNHTDCRPCLLCETSARRYWRYDRAAPPLSNPKTLCLQSLPQEQHRIPTSILVHPETNLTDYFTNLNQQQGASPKPYLFEYNPSIVAKPDSMNFDPLKDGNQVVYVASFRVATTQACFDTDTTLAMIGGAWESEKRPQKKDYLGLALLRDDLSVVAEAIVDLPRPFRKREDFRLFVLHGQMYVATYCKLTPIWIMHQSQAKTYETRLQFNPSNPVHSWNALQPFDSPLRVKIGSDITQCAQEPNDNKHTKNLNYFVNSQQETMVEMFPLAPHTVRHLKHVKDPTAATPTRADDITTTELPPPSFYTLEEAILADEMDFFEPPFTQDRGGACCIEIQHPVSHKKLWLGIAHVKTPHARRKLKGRLASNQYLSRWYAFEPDHPYKVVAVSGFFCLPRPTYNNNNNPLVAHSAPHSTWTLGSRTMECPVIHFVTGMTEKVDDSSTLILAYGVADCTSWFAEVKKEDIVQMLFFEPKESSSEKKR